MSKYNPYRGLVSVDLDSTISCTLPRRHLIDQCIADNSFVAYSMACMGDTPGPALPFVQWLTEMAHPWIVVSARDNEARELTEKWLADHGAIPDAMYLNHGTHDSQGLQGHGEWKAARMLEAQKEMNTRISFHMDDHADVAIATAKIGIPTILVRDLEFGGDFLG